MTSLTPSGSFGDRLIKAVRARRSHAVVGLDPHLKLLPPSLLRGVSLADRDQVAGVLEKFCAGVIDAVCDLVPAVKPQVAFFERLGAPGFAALERVVRLARDRGLLVNSDAKRGDIGSTAEAYAECHIGSFRDELGEEHEVIGADAVTVNPYLGSDSLEPFVRLTGRGKGVFLLAKTSNPGSAEFQDQTLASGDGTTTLYEAVAAMADRLGEPSVGREGYGAVGIVVGATHPEEAEHLRRRFPRLLFLVPGFGSQGGRPGDVVGCFNEDGLGAVVNASRSVIFAYREDEYAALGEARWAECSRLAAQKMNQQINAALEQARKVPW